MLNLSLYDDVNTEESKWVTESVGTMVFNLTKAEGGLWKRLTDDPRKINIWWDMRQIYRKDMDDYFSLLENESENKKKKKSKKQNEKEKEKEKEPITVEL
jgi:hypothetical protein